MTDANSAAATTILTLDPAAEADRIAVALRAQMQQLKRRGFIVAVSGGVDSSVCVGLAVRAVGAARVFALFLPERDSDPRSRELFKEWIEALGVDHVVEDISPILEASGCYRRRDEAIRRVVPDYGDGWGCKLVLPGDRLDTDRLNVTHLTVRAPDGEEQTIRLPAAEYRQIVAATNFKQRVRKMLEYYHSDRLHYAVVGTPNRLEYDQGFFVKGGDGLADVKPIAHLYKSQVYQLAGHLGVPRGVTDRLPTTDTFSLPQSQEEFYFSLPARTLDVVLFAYNAGKGPEEAAVLIGLDAGQVERVYRDIEQKRSTTRYLHAQPLLVEPVPGVGGLEGHP
ncbi:MAG: NAD(+) synthase [Gemmatimonadales bacterium]|nr:NAD(+) synthase [Gemmatimonadales bacterium]